MAYSRRRRGRKSRRRRGRYKRRRYSRYKRTSNSKINRIWKYLKATKPEWKYSVPDLYNNTLPISIGTGMVYYLHNFPNVNQLGMGSFPNQRIGNKINKNIHKIRFTLDLPEAWTFGSCYVRVIYFQVKSGGSGAGITPPSLNDLFQNITAEYLHVSPFLDGVSAEYRIIWDKLRTMNINSGSSSWVMKGRFKPWNLVWKQQGGFDSYYPTADNPVFMLFIIRLPLASEITFGIPLSIASRLVFQDN